MDRHIAELRRPGVLEKLTVARRIAALHERNGVKGRIEIANGGVLGGGLFRLYLP